VIPDEQNRLTKNGHSLFKLSFIELLLANDAFTKQLNSQQLGVLDKIVLDQYTRKAENPDFYNLYTIKQSFLLGAVIIDKNVLTAKTTEQIKTAKQYIEKYSHAEPALITEISKILSEI
jgi:hypothetical protein